MSRRLPKDRTLIDSEGEYTEEINDKLNDLWTQMKQKKNSIMKTITPTYTRRHNPMDQSCTRLAEDSKQNQPNHNNLSSSSPINSSGLDPLHLAETEILKLRDRLAKEVTRNKHKDIQIAALKKNIVELANDKKQLIAEITSLSALAQESPTRNNPQPDESRRSASQAINEQSSISKVPQMSELQAQVIQGARSGQSKKETNPDTERLLELLRSTEEYREFVFYHNNNELSFLKTLAKMKKKNCSCNYSEKEKSLWAPKDIISMVRDLNVKQAYGLTNDAMENIIYHINLLYLQREKQKTEQLKSECDKKLREAERHKNHELPYDLMQVQKYRERELLKLGNSSKKKRRANSTLRVPL